MAAATSLTSRRRNRSPSAPRTVARLRVDCLSDDDNVANNRVVVQVPRPAPLLNGARRPFIEVFAGSCHLSDAFRKLGYQTFPIDVKISTQPDLKLGSHFVMDVISKLEAKTGLKPYIHFAPPCSTYSQARYPRIRSSACPGGLLASQLTAHDRTVLKYANKITHNTFHAMRELSRKGYPVTLEQPSGSLMEDFQDMGMREWRNPDSPGLLPVRHALSEAHLFVELSRCLSHGPCEEMPWQP